MTKYRLKKDTPDHRAGELFVLMSNNGIYEIDAGEDDPAVFYGGDIKNFDEWFEEVKESGWWKPNYGDKYYTIRSNGECEPYFWREDIRDKCFQAIGNVFKTKEAAERYRDYLEAVATVRQDEGVIDLQRAFDRRESVSSDDFSIYTIAHNFYPRQLVVVGSLDCMSANAIWFDTEEHAQSSLDNHPDEWKTITNYDWSKGEEEEL